MALNQLTAVKEKMYDIKNQVVHFKVNKGRNKIITFKGKVVGVYPGMFMIEPLEDIDLDRFSYSYFDYLCGDIKIIDK